MRSVLLVTVVTAAFLLAGCPKRDVVKEGAGDGSADSSSTSSSGANRPGLESGSSLDSQNQNAMQGGALADRTIYFDYDSSEIRSEYAAIVSNHARSLTGNPNQRVRLEGHSDERGSREYNIGLGERRAQAVRRALMLQGVGENQIATVSYGEERPAVEGADDSAWSKNRRVEIVYAN